MARERYIIVDDHPMFRAALRQAVQSAFAAAEVVETGSLAELETELADNADVGLVLLDLSMPGVHGFSGLLFLRTQHPAVPVIIVSASDDPATIRKALAFGAAGFIPKTQPVERMREAIRKVLDGDLWTPPDIDLSGDSDPEMTELAARLSTLTPQQVRVLMMLREGLLNKQIAYNLGVSEATIKAHVSAILQKLGVDSRTQAVIAITRVESVEGRRIELG